MKFDYTVFRTDGTSARDSVEWPADPQYKHMSALIEPLVGGPMEHVTVLHNDKRADMFVNELGHVLASGPLPYNAAATKIYRAASMRRDPTQIADDLPIIVGDAVLFDEIVWS